MLYDSYNLTRKPSIIEKYCKYYNRVLTDQKKYLTHTQTHTVLDTMVIKFGKPRDYPQLRVIFSNE